MTVARRAQAFLVDRIKTRAIVDLHRTARGEALLLEIYLWAEEGGEGDLLSKLTAHPLPVWLTERMARHIADEARHAGLLRARLREMGMSPRPPQIDVVSRWKMRALERIVARAASDFREGAKVPLFAVASRMETMGVRVMERHLRALTVIERRLAGRHPARDLLQQIAADERHHVTSCEETLFRLVGQNEARPLRALLKAIDRVDRAFGVLGALGLGAMGLWFRVASLGPKGLGAERPQARPG